MYWVERGGKAQKNLALNAAPIDVADYLRRRLFESDTSVDHDERDAGDFSEVPQSVLPRPKTPGSERRALTAPFSALGIELLCQTRRRGGGHAAAGRVRRSITSGR